MTSCAYPSPLHMYITVSLLVTTVLLSINHTLYTS